MTDEITCRECHKYLTGTASTTRPLRLPCGETETKTFDISVHNLIGLQKKLYGRGTKTFLCFDCMLRDLGITPDTAIEMAESFKEGGCTLFS